MNDNDFQVRAILKEAGTLENGTAKLMLIEEAIRLADSAQDIGLGYSARQDLIHCATFSGYAERALVAFTWCLAQCDRHPEQFQEKELFWQYKWIAGSIGNFPRVSLKQIAGLLDDMTRRYQRASIGLQPVVRQRCKLAVTAGKLEEAHQFYEQMQILPRNHMSDCLACERDSDTELFFLMGKNDRALEIAEPILRGKMKCAEVPHHTYATVLLTLFKLGRVEEAMAYHIKGYPMIVRNKEFIAAIGKHLGFLVLTDNLAKATKCFEQHVQAATEIMSLNRRFEFYLGAMLLFERLLQTGKKNVACRLPKDIPAAHDNGKYDLADLIVWIHQELKTLADMFDQRNGNSYFAKRIDDYWRLLEKVTPFPIPKR